MNNPFDFAFLDELKTSDFYLLAPKVFPVYRQDWPTVRSEAFRKFFVRHPDVSGALGELYLNAFLRRWIQMHPKSDFIDAVSYSLLNPDGKKPDGLVVRRTAEGVVVQKILESKMGSAPFDTSQLYGLLRVWQLRGLRLEDGTHIQPDKIQVQIGNEEVQLSTLSLRVPSVLKKMEKSVWLFASKHFSEDFAGEVQKTPFSSSDLAIFSKRFLAYAWLGPKGNSQKVEEIIKAEPPLPFPGHLGKKRLIEPRFHEPKKNKVLSSRVIPFSIFYPDAPLPTLGLKPVKVPDPAPKVAKPPKSDFVRRSPLKTFPPGEENPVNNPENRKAQLFDFIRRAGKFPTKTKSRGLAQFVESIGGQMAAFAELLDDETRQILIDNDTLPAVSPMERWLRMVDLAVDSERAEKMMAIYLNRYGDSSFANELKATHPGWAQIFSNKSLSAWRERLCAKNLGDLARPPAEEMP